MWLNNYEWHLDYVRVAKDCSFSFEKTKFPLDKNKMCLLDLDKIIEEKDVGIIEQCLPLIVQYNVDTNEHIGILDQNFWKLFRMSQLAVEYLLFCKKYLDDTVTLLKEELNDVKMENNELKAFNKELKQHTDTLLVKLKKREELTTTFRCNKCSKAFSTEEYLSAHIGRRHNNKNTESSEFDVEMEIKNMKEKLNTTEKLIKNEELNPKLEDTLNKNYSKVGYSLKNLESQMQALWDKLQELDSKTISAQKIQEINDISHETHKNESEQPLLEKTFSSNLEITSNKSAEQSSVFEENIMKGDIFVEPSPGARYDDMDDKKELLVEQQKSTAVQSLKLPVLSKSKTKYDDLDRIDDLDEMEPSKTITVVKSANSLLYETEEKDSNEEDTQLSSEVISKSELSPDDDSNKDFPLHKEKSGSTLGRRSISSLKRASLSSEVMERLKKEMEKVLGERLSVLGVSNEWEGIPHQTYLRIMNILTHQAKLVKKSVPNYKTIRKELLNKVEQKLSNEGPLGNAGSRKKNKKSKIQGSSLARTWSVKSSSLRIKKHQSAPQVEIKNRQMYKSDSSEEENQLLRKTVSSIIHRTSGYSAVIEELKQVQKPEESLQQYKDEVQTSLPDNNRNLRMKGVLKNLPTSGPIPKKRVLFDLKSKDSEIPKPLTRDAGEGSTTSVASSVLDLSEDSLPVTDNEKKLGAELDIQDFSDSDFSIPDSKTKIEIRKDARL